MSRPREIDPETNQVRMLGVSISVANHDALKALAAARGCSMSAIVRPLIDAEIALLRAAKEQA